jgi:hypothetical protein
MSQADPGDEGPVAERQVQSREASFARGALAGIASVTLATIVVGVAAAVIALVVALAF